MIIKLIKVEKMYGRVNLALNLNHDLSILVGINGSGKTTAIKVIDWLLTPHYDEISSTRFSNISVTIEVDGSVYRIGASPTDPDDGTPMKALFVKCLSDPAKRFTDILIPDSSDGAHWSKAGFTLNDNERKTHDFIKSLGAPVIVSLDRKITAEIDDSIYIEGVGDLREVRSLVRGGRSTKTPLDYVQDIFRQNYASLQAELEAINANLRKRIILATLANYSSLDDRAQSLTTPEGFERFAFKSQQIMSGSGVDADIMVSLSEFLTQSEEKVRDYHARSYFQQSSDDTIFRETLGRVAALMKVFRIHGFERRRASQPIDRYITTVNQFLHDTGKAIFVERETGRLRFRYDTDSDEGRGRALVGLSSGELQILVVLGLLGLGEKSKRVFIVDEPELSLHPKWQSNFMNGIQLLSHRNAQLIVATHSPEIVAPKKNKCIIVR